jgi:high-affinity iron transporter
MSFQVSNHTSLAMDVQLSATGSRRIYAEIPTLGPGTSRTLRVTLGPGSYTWRCTDVTDVSIASDPGRVRGKSVVSGHWYIPVNPTDLATAAAVYRASVTVGLQALVTDTDRLQQLVDAGQLQAAKSQWLVAHLDYERLGAAYGTFGRFDEEINGRADGLPLGVTDPGFTGFRRLEYGLWAGQSLPELGSVTDQLDGFVHGLQAAFPTQTFVDTDLPLRTHEILENALQFEMTADTDEGSHTNLATVAANVEGAQGTLDALLPLLKVRNPALLAASQSGLARLEALIETYDQGGVWTPVQSLTSTQREQLDGTISSLLETLAQIPATLQVLAVGGD